jgi:putative spermidine/putrescine transport system ATP-binding protein
MRDGEVRQVGTPEDLFSRPDHRDVAEFMGFRNQVPGRVVSVADGSAVVDVGRARISGRVREPVAAGDAAVIAIRPDDLRAIPAGNGGLVATVSASEFRGREFVGFARTGDGIDLSFHAGERLTAGEAVHLGAAPDRVLVFSGSAP